MPSGDSAVWVQPFAQISAADLPRVGGKGANLGELTRAGFPVPPGFCVTTDAFSRFMAGLDAEGEVYAPLAALAGAGALAGGDVDRLRQVGAAVRARLAALPVPPEVAAAVVGAWQALGSEHAYAVRSSATAEDLPGASFAGQQDTYLNIQGQAALIDAVRACWVSLFTDRAIAYRAQNGFDHRAVRLSVVVQRMVLPEVSGILFTADPLTGNRHVTSIDAGFGLGEALVSGVVSADLYRVDTRTARLIEVRVADKALAIRPLPDGGTERVALTEAQRKAQALSERQAVDLALLGGRIAAHYGTPQDIEWCIDGRGDVYIVQARPITSLYPLPEPRPADDALHLYISFSHAQVMTDPMPALARSVWRTLIPFGKPGSPSSESRNMTGAGGRLYLDITALMLQPFFRRELPRVLTAADRLIAAAVEQVANRPDFIAGETKTPHVGMVELAKTLLPVMAQLQLWLWWRDPKDGVRVAGEICEAAVATSHARLMAAPAGAARLREAQSVLGGLFLTMILRLAPLLGSGMVARLLLLRMTRSPELVNTALQGLSGNVTTEMDLAVGDLADVARAHPAVAARLLSTDVRSVLDGLESVEGGPDFLAALHGFLDRYGARGPSEIDISRLRWREDPASLLQTVVGNLQHSQPGTHRAFHNRQAAAGESAARQLVDTVPPGLLAPLRRRVVRRLTVVMRNLSTVREHPKFMLIRTLMEIKEAVLESAEGLVAAGRLEEVGDVWHLSLAELVAVLEDPDVELADADSQHRPEVTDARPGLASTDVQPAHDLRAVVAARKAEHARFAHMRPPRVMTSDGEIPEVRLDHGDLPAGALPGSAASAGVVEGIAKVVLDPGRDMVAHGEILVAPFTDPGWTPLFINAAGLVMEVGGLMTHGSVVAREYGIPAVVGVVDATQLIRTGQRVRVNGDRGYVELVGEGEAEGASEAAQ